MIDPIRVCLVGAGRAAKVHANSLVNHVPRGKAVAMVDTQRQVLEETADQYGIQERYPDLKTALERSQFEAVVITTPTFKHVHLAILALQAGKHVFLEKPMALNLADCDEIIQAAEENQVFLS